MQQVNGAKPSPLKIGDYVKVQTRKPYKERIVRVCELNMSQAYDKVESILGRDAKGKLDTHDAKDILEIVRRYNGVEVFEGVSKAWFDSIFGTQKFMEMCMDPANRDPSQLFQWKNEAGETVAMTISYIVNEENTFAVVDSDTNSMLFQISRDSVQLIANFEQDPVVKPADNKILLPGDNP